MIYKLKYDTKELALADLKSKGVIDDTGKYCEGTQAIVELNLIETPGTCDDEGNEITPIIYKPGYRIDIMIDREIPFESEVYPEVAAHEFL